MAREIFFLICIAGQRAILSRMPGRRQGILRNIISSFRGRRQLDRQHDVVGEKWRVLGENQIGNLVTHFFRLKFLIVS